MNFKRFSRKLEGIGKEEVDKDQGKGVKKSRGSRRRKVQISEGGIKEGFKRYSEKHN